MAKVDLKSFSSIEDWPLLGIHWRKQFYLDKCLPFGLRSVPYLFNMVANSLKCILKHYFTVEH